MSIERFGDESRRVRKLEAQIPFAGSGGGGGSGITQLTGDVHAGPSSGVTAATVVALMGIALSYGTHALNDLLFYNTTGPAWENAAPSGDVAPGASLGQLTVSGLQGHPVSNIAPTTNYVLTWTGSAWAPSPTQGGGGGGGITTLTGDVDAGPGTGSQDATVVGLQTRPVSATAPSTGQALVWSGSAWAPANVNGLITWDDDLLTSTNGAQWVSSISGASGSGALVQLNTQGFHWAKGVSNPTISQDTETIVSTPQNITISPQQVFTGTTAAELTPGSLLLEVGNPGSSGSTRGAWAGLYVNEPSSTGVFAVSGGTFYTTINESSGATLWLGPAAVMGTSDYTNWTIQYDNPALPSTGTSYSSPNDNAGELVMYDNGNVIIYNGDTGEYVGLQALLGSQTAPLYAYLAADASGGLVLNPGYQLVQAAAISEGQHVTALNAFSFVTTSNVPSGDGVTWVANRNAEPGASPEGGFLLYSNGGNPWVYTSSGVKFEILPAGSGGGLVTGVDVVADVDNAHVYVISISGSDAGGGAVPLNGTYLHAASDTTIIASRNHANTADIIVLSTSGIPNGVILGDGVNVGPVIVNPGAGSNFGVVVGPSDTVASLGAQSTDFVAFGTTPSATGFVRVPSNSTIVTARNHANTEDIAVLSTNGTPNGVILGDGANVGSVIVNPTSVFGIVLGLSNTIGSLAAQNTDFIAFDVTPAQSGYIRGGNGTTLVAARNAGNSGDIAALLTDASNNVYLGGYDNTGGTSGNVNVRVYAPGSGTTEAYAQVVRNVSGTDTMVWAFGRASAQFSGIWAHGLTPGASNYSFLGGSTSTIINAPNSSGSVQFQVASNQVGQLGAASTDFIAFGGVNVTTPPGFIRTPNNNPIIGSLNGSGAGMNVLQVDGSGNVLIGDSSAGLGVTINGGTGGNVILAVHGATYLECSGSTVQIVELLNFLTSTASSATTGTASGLPELPETYIEVEVAGTLMKIPAYLN